MAARARITSAPTDRDVLDPVADPNEPPAASDDVDFVNAS